MGAVAGLKPRKTTGISGSGKSSDHVEPRTLPRRRREVGATASSKPRTATGGSGSGSERGEPGSSSRRQREAGAVAGPEQKAAESSSSFCSGRWEARTPPEARTRSGGPSFLKIAPFFGVWRKMRREMTLFFTSCHASRFQATSSKHSKFLTKIHENFAKISN